MENPGIIKESIHILDHIKRRTLNGKHKKQKLNKLSERFISKTLHIRVNTPNIKEILEIKKKNPNY